MTTASPGAGLPAGSILSPPSMDPELWATCAGPLLQVPAPSSLAVYFPRGHVEHGVLSHEAAADLASRIPHPPQVLCRVLAVTAKADVRSEELSLVYHLEPILEESNLEVGRIWTAAEAGTTPDDEWPPLQWGNPKAVWKVLSKSDAASQGGLSLPRRAAEACMPPLDMSQEVPTQVVMACDLLGNPWQFRQVYRGSPKRHLLTSHWNHFMAQKKIRSADRIVFVKGEAGKVKVGIRRNEQRCSSLDPRPEHILKQAALCHRDGLAFQVVFNVRSSGRPFVLPLEVLCNSLKQVALMGPGRRFKYLVEEADFSVARLTGTVLPSQSTEQVQAHLGASMLQFSRLGPLWRCIHADWADPEPSLAHLARPEAISPWELLPVVGKGAYNYQPRAQHSQPLGRATFGGQGAQALSSTGQEQADGSALLPERWAQPRGAAPGRLTQKRRRRNSCTHLPALTTEELQVQRDPALVSKELKDEDEWNVSRRATAQRISRSLSGTSRRSGPWGNASESMEVQEMQPASAPTPPHGARREPAPVVGRALPGLAPVGPGGALKREASEAPEVHPSLGFFCVSPEHPGCDDLTLSLRPPSTHGQLSLEAFLPPPWERSLPQDGSATAPALACDLGLALARDPNPMESQPPSVVGGNPDLASFHWSRLTSHDGQSSRRDLVTYPHNEENNANDLGSWNPVEPTASKVKLFGHIFRLLAE